MSHLAEKLISDELAACWALLPDKLPGDRLSDAIKFAVAKARDDGRESMAREVSAVLHGQHPDLTALVAALARFVEQSLAPSGVEGGEGSSVPLPVVEVTEPEPGHGAAGSDASAPARASLGGGS